MKVYQIFKATGWGDDYYRYAIKTYLHKSKAEVELETAEYDDEDLTYTCKNSVDSYDAPSYSIEEFDVDESEDTSNERY